MGCHTKIIANLLGIIKEKSSLLKKNRLGMMFSLDNTLLFQHKETAPSKLSHKSTNYTGCYNKNSGIVDPKAKV